jgi:acyl carrier protein
MSETTSERVVRVISTFKKIPPGQVGPGTTFEQLGLDSLDGLNLVFELEEEFNLSIPDDRALTMRTVAQVVEGIEKLLKGEEPASNAAQTST